MSERKGLFKFLKIDQLIDDLSNLVETRIELAKIEVREEIAKIIVSFSSVLIISLFGLFTLLFISIGLAFYLNELWHSLYQGFFAVGGIYLLIALIVYLLKKKLPIKSAVQKLIRNNGEEDEE